MQRVLQIWKNVYLCNTIVVLCHEYNMNASDFNWQVWKRKTWLTFNVSRLNLSWHKNTDTNALLRDGKKVNQVVEVQLRFPVSSRLDVIVSDFIWTGGLVVRVCYWYSDLVSGDKSVGVGPLPLHVVTKNFTRLACEQSAANVEPVFLIKLSISDGRFLWM